MVSAKDITILSGKLIDAIYKQKTNIVSTNFQTPETMVLDFDSLISTQIMGVQIADVPGEKTPLIK